MNLEHYRTAFACCCLVLILIILAPMFGTVFPFQRNNERFSELWILGSNHLAEDYPLNVAIGENHNIFVGVSNHMGHSIYYIVYVKLRNQNQTAPSSATSNPSPLAPLYEFHFVIDEGKTWEKPIVFSFPEVSYCEDGLNLTKISINEAIFSIKSLAIRDSNDTGYYCQLFFELWICDRPASGFRYDNRFVDIWLNMTTGHDL